MRALAAVAAVAASAGLAFALDPEVKRKALSADETDRWNACTPLAKDGSPEAMKLLLGILIADEDLENRDNAAWACWYLPSDEAVDALAALAKSQPLTRVRVAYGLARSRRPHALDTLVRMAKNDSVAVRCEAVDGMRHFPGSPIALETCRAAARSSETALRACAIDAAGALKDGAGRDIVLAAWSEFDEGLRCAALDAMGSDDAMARLPDAAHAKGWRLRAQAVRTALAWRSPQCVETLIPLVADGTPRVAGAALRALRFLSGKEIAPDPELWRAWWTANAATWKPPTGTPNDAAAAPPDPKSTRARFQGLEIDSDSVAFVLDHSTSMEKQMGTGGRRIDAVRAELRSTLAALPDGVRVNLVTFGENVRAFAPSARPLNAKTRQAISAFSQETTLESETNLAGGVLKALEDDAIDTVYLLTDGSPTIGDYVSFTRVRLGVERANRTRRVAVHTIGFGVTGDNTKRFLKNLADDNDGQYVLR